MWFKKKQKSLNARRLQSETPNQKVFSYYTASKKQLNSFDRHNQALRLENINKSRYKSFLRNWFFVFFIIVTILIVGYVMSLSRQATLDIKGPIYRQRSEYKKIVDSILETDIKNFSKATINSNSIKNTITQKLPESNKVIINTDILSHRPWITIYNDNPLAVFKNPDSTSYILSDHGKLLLPVDISTIDLARLPVINNQTGINGKAGDQFLSPEEANNFASLLSQDESASGMVNYILPANPREIYLAATMSREYQIRYLLNNEITLQHGAYKAAIKKLAELNQLPTKYIDVRLIDKVYYQ